MKYNASHTTYINTIGQEVPSVTTILKILNKPSLVKWANFLGFKRQSVDTVLDATSEIGTTVHLLIYSFLLNKYFIMVNGRYCGKTTIKLHMNSFLDWYKQNKVNPEFMEKSMSGDKFGGTVDFYGTLNGKKTILDFKTSKQIYSSMFLQLAAYCIMLEAEGKIVEQVGILAIRDNGYKEKIITREELQKYIDTFKILAELFHMWFDINDEDGWGSIL